MSTASRPFKLFALAATLAAGLACSGAAMAEGLNYNTARIDAQASQEVARDRVRLILTARERNRDRQKAADAVTRACNKIFEAGRKEKDVRVSLTGRYAHPEGGYSFKSSEQWVDQATILVEGADAGKVFAFAAANQSLASIQDVTFDVSDATKAKMEEKLMDQLISNFESKAKYIAKRMGAKSYRIVNMDFSDSVREEGPRNYMNFSMDAVSAKAEAAPAMAPEAGSQKLTMTMTGVIQLQ